MTAPPLTGRCSTPLTLNVRPWIFQIRRASWMTVPYTGSTFARLVLVCSGPAGKVPVPPVVHQIAAGREVVPVWINEVGGVTFRIAGSTERAAEFVKTATPQWSAHLAR